MKIYFTDKDKKNLEMLLLSKKIFSFLPCGFFFDCLLIPKEV